ncbi:MAG: hypothetical protein AAFN93_05985, partial [Bacteroidota bacterium]
MAIQKILEITYESGSYDQLKEIIPDIEHFQQEVETLTKTTGTQIANYVRRTIISPLQDSDDIIFKARAEIIFKHLSKAHKLKSTNEDHFDKEVIQKVNQGIKKIRISGTFTKAIDTPKKEGDRNSYRALEQFFRDTTHISGSNQKINKSSYTLHTLKLAIVVLNIRLEKFENIIKNGNVNHFENSKRDKSKIVWTGVFVVIGITIYLFILFPNGESSKSLNNKRKRISSSQLLNGPYKLSENIPSKDTIIISTDTVFYENELIGEERFGLEKIWIKLRIANLSDKIAYFPDGIYLRQLKLSTLAGQLNRRPITVNDPSSNLQIKLGAEQTENYEWVIINKDGLTPLTPRNEVYSLIEISCSENCESLASTFELLWRFHDSNYNTYEIKSDRIYEIGFE